MIPLVDFRNNPARRLIVILFDASVVVFSLLMAYYLRFDLRIPEHEWRYLSRILPWGVACFMSAFLLCGIYTTVWRYASVRDAWRIVKAIGLGLGALFFIDFVTPGQTIPRSVYVIAGMLLVLGMGASRFGWRVYCEWKYGLFAPITVGKRRNTLIVGAGAGGVLVARELRKVSSKMLPIGFIDDETTKLGKRIQGLKVLGSTEEIADLVDQYMIEEIIIAMPSVVGAKLKRIVELCKQTRANLQILPNIGDLVSGKVSVSKLRNVEVEDLLGREPVVTDFQRIATYLHKKTVLVTGAGGSIGGELVRQIAAIGPASMVLIGQGENSIHQMEQEMRDRYPRLVLHTYIADVKNRHVISRIFEEHQPDAVFHAAAHKHVPLMEKQPEEAVKNNAWGTKVLAELALQFGVECFVMISSDKAVRPTSAMGASKRFAELVVQHYAAEAMKKGSDKPSTRFAVVRFGNVLGSRGSVVPIFKRQIAQGGPVTVTHPDMVRYFMTIPKAVALVLQAGAQAHGGEIFVLDMGEPVKIADLAKDLIRLSGLEPMIEIPIVYTGMRPGEKLYEELSHEGESLEQTSHERIMRISDCIGAYCGSPVPIQRLVRMSEQDMMRLSREEAVRQLELVNPGYHWDGAPSICRAERVKMAES
ncbi:polysaccharide biosynthesis protein [Heliophilum fasciatum]|uniref:FlaA1/EpsC-like NDP-sugar epimerase n=1 Tax=Heliophilum fasciatum TaxID=35700 RepID=A0A4R2RXM6_9FIRM|nr:nucleoside-diphosphate sugar epimerase/dehydratase [Heliophilum fasciatum]MCW2277109.1 FlaA1/EpsC-like NDP-sugar epimerase [Heliophilum fasciatum]TCP68254.1 FlaA1/EpsC-like NDP-sugar epimerase [Heliophilum fasciatum]